MKQWPHQVIHKETECTRFYSHWFTSPVFPEDEEKTRRAYLLNLILPFLVVAAFLNIAIDLSSGILYTTLPLGTVVLALLVAFYLNRKGYVKMAGIVVLLVILAALTLTLIQGHGIHDVGILIFPLVIVLASLMLDRLDLLVITGLCLLAVLLLVGLELNGLLHPQLDQAATDWGDFLIVALILSLISFVIRIFGDQLRATLICTRQNERALS